LITVELKPTEESLKPFFHFPCNQLSPVPPRLPSSTGDGRHWGYRDAVNYDRDRPS